MVVGPSPRSTSDRLNRISPPTPCAALPADECDCEHWIANILCYAKYIHILDITLNKLSNIRRIETRVCLYREAVDALGLRRLVNWLLAALDVRQRGHREKP